MIKAYKAHTVQQVKGNIISKSTIFLKKPKQKDKGDILIPMGSANDLEIENIIFPNNFNPADNTDYAKKYYIDIKSILFADNKDYQLYEVDINDKWDFSITVNGFNLSEIYENKIDKNNYDNNNKGNKSAASISFHTIDTNINENDIIIYYQILKVNPKVNNELDAKSGISYLKQYFRSYDKIYELPKMLDNTIREGRKNTGIEMIDNVSEDKFSDMFTKSLEGIYINENINSIMNLLLNKRNIKKSLIEIVDNVDNNEYSSSKLYYKNITDGTYDDTLFYKNFYKYYEDKANQKIYAPITNLCAFFVLANISKNEIIQKKLKQNVGIETVPVAVPKPVPKPVLEPVLAPEPVLTQAPLSSSLSRERLGRGRSRGRGRPVRREIPSSARGAQKQQYKYINKDKMEEILTYSSQLKGTLTTQLDGGTSIFISPDLQTLIDNEYGVLYETHKLNKLHNESGNTSSNIDFGNFMRDIKEHIPTYITKIKKKLNNGEFSHYLIILNEFLTTSGNNYLISEDQYKTLLNKTLLEAGINKPINEKVAANEFQKANTDGSGKISFLEYFKLSIKELSKMNIKERTIMIGGDGQEGGDDTRTYYEEEMCKTQIGMLKDFEQIINTIVTPE